MNDHHRPGAVPRDLPDQQARPPREDPDQERTGPDADPPDEPVPDEPTD